MLGHSNLTMACPQNNRNLRVINEPVVDGADAMVFDRFDFMWRIRYIIYLMLLYSSVLNNSTILLEPKDLTLLCIVSGFYNMPPPNYRPLVEKVFRGLFSLPDNLT